MRHLFTKIGLLLGLMASCAAFGQNGVVNLESYPAMSVADGRSTVTVTAQIRDDGGRLVPDGTQVIFDTNQGNFRDRVVTTSNGYARAVLVAPSLPGVARVRASALRFNAVTEIEVEFVSDRSQLSTAREYFEIEGSETLQYAVQDKVIEATGANKGAIFTYRNVTIIADDMRVRVPSYEVKARRAIMKVNGKEFAFDELYYRANRRTGFGLASIQRVVKSDGPVGVGMPPLKTVPYYGLVEVNSRGVVPTDKTVDERQFNYQNMAESVSRIEAKSAVVFPQKEVQFHSANVIVTGQSLMKTPLFKVPVNSSSPLVTEQFINVSNNDVAVNYPFYLKLGPTESQLFRFRWGNRYATGTGATGGSFIDYEWNWSQSQNADGGLSLFGLGRSDWGAGIRQNWLLDPGSALALQVDFPAHRSMFASANFSKQLGAVNGNWNASYGQSLSGNRVTSDSVSMVLEGEPIRFSSLGANLYVGLNAAQRNLHTPTVSSFNQTAGLQSRLVGKSQKIGTGASVNWSYTFGPRFQSSESLSMTHLFDVGMSAQPAPSLGVNLNYNFTEDGFTSSILGRHRLSAEAFYNPGRLSFSGAVSKALDVDQINASARMRYEVGPLWKFYYQYSYDQFGPDSFLDQSVILSYKLGFREVGLSYSQRTKRLGIEILGTSFN